MLRIKNIHRILIANRGEIVGRILRTNRKLGIESVIAVTSEEGIPNYAKEADQFVNLKGNSLKETLLNCKQWIEIAQKYECDAIHPGYGLLSENANFAQACERAGIIFIGPNSETIRLMGNKQAARQFVRKLKINIPQAVFIHSAEDSSEFNSFPAILKAPLGGGGKGIIRVKNREELLDVLPKAFAEVSRYYGEHHLILEQYIENSRHIEVQILADHFGNVIHLFERECSVQRRHQKIVEEAPASVLSAENRKKVTEQAVTIARKSNYCNAGTVEFLMDEQGVLYFLEMNTRIQVEHPVSEMISGVDIVEQQIRIAENKPLLFTQDKIKINGHALEVRICAENPELDFAPAPGMVHSYSFPLYDFLRIETFLQNQTPVLSDYDSLLAKLIVWGENRHDAIYKMEKVLKESSVTGTETNLTYLYEIVQQKDFQQNTISTQWLENSHSQLKEIQQQKKEILSEEPPLLAAFSMLFYFGLQPIPIENPPLNNGRWRIFPQTNFRFKQKDISVFIWKNDSGKWEIQWDKHTLMLENLSIDKEKIAFGIEGKTHSFYWYAENQFTLYLNYRNHHFMAENPVLENLRLKSTDRKLHFQENLQSPLHGRVVEIKIGKGSQIHKGEVLLVIESMKMENQITAAFDAAIKEVLVELGAKIIPGQPLITFTNPINLSN